MAATPVASARLVTAAAILHQLYAELIKMKTMILD